MKNNWITKILGILIFTLSIFINALADCYDCESEASDAYSDSRKAYYWSSDIDECQWYARKAMRHFSDAESYASDCNCYDAEAEAYDGYRDAKMAYWSSDLEDCQWYARKAMRHASEVESYANYCN